MAPAAELAQVWQADAFALPPAFTVGGMPTQAKADIAR
jgi:hypothetical protein